MKLKTNPVVYWSLLIVNEWSFIVAATSEGLCYIGSQNNPLDELTEWVTRHYPKSQIVQAEEKLEPYLMQFIEFFEGERTEFTLPVDLRGTPFQITVWTALSRIPYGQTRSYSDIAQYIQKPSSTRAVGAAIGANPILILVPCHRVIGKNGSLTGYRGGLQMKTKLLQLEFSRFG